MTLTLCALLNKRTSNKVLKFLAILLFSFFLYLGGGGGGGGNFLYMAVYEWVIISDDLVYEWVRFFHRPGTCME